MENERKKNKFSCFGKRERGFVNPIRAAKRWCTNVKYACQRIRYGYCERDMESMDLWFLNVVPNMLSDLRANTQGFPTEIAKKVGYDLQNPDEEKEQAAKKEWDSVLEEMIHYLREANEDTCQKKNPYEEQYDAAWQEFNEKYNNGEKLKSAEEKAEEKKNGLSHMHFPKELPEYKGVVEKFMEEEKVLESYRDECKDKGLQLFGKWFWSLWD